MISSYSFDDKLKHTKIKVSARVVYYLIRKNATQSFQAYGRRDFFEPNK